MLVKEYRICLPLTVEEYRIAQLYMIAKKSKEESHGRGSGVEILVNEPYTNGPGGSGQYTKKIFHVGSHLPQWLKAVMPKTALMVEEEAWNAYPYTRTKYTCPFIEKFFIDIETRYFPDRGTQENVFGLKGSELKERGVDRIDLVIDKVSDKDYKAEEDPTLYKSQKTGRGPLDEEWVRTSNPIMCAYKLCKVEFRYWGLQSKIERFIHQVGLRGVMVKAHRQVWCWQDEWYGMTIDDIRRMERETQEALAAVMQHAEAEEGDDESAEEADDASGSSARTRVPAIEACPSSAASPSSSSSGHAGGNAAAVDTTATHNFTPPPLTPSGSFKKLPLATKKSLDILQRHSDADLIDTSAYHRSNTRLSMNTDDDDDLSDSSADEFFDAEDSIPGFSSLRKSASSNLKHTSAGKSHAFGRGSVAQDMSLESLPMLQRTVQIEHTGDGVAQIRPSILPGASDAEPETPLLALVVRGNNILEGDSDALFDPETFLRTLCDLAGTHFQQLASVLNVRSIHCGDVSRDALRTLRAIDPDRYTQDTVHASTLAMFAFASSEYRRRLDEVVDRLNAAYRSFVDKSDLTPVAAKGKKETPTLKEKEKENRRMSGLSAFKLRPPSFVFGLTSSSTSPNDKEKSPHLPQQHSATPPMTPPGATAQVSPARGNSGNTSANASTNASSSNNNNDDASCVPKVTLIGDCVGAMMIFDALTQRPSRLEFEVDDFFAVGSPIGLMLAARRRFDSGAARDAHAHPPKCKQVYNVFVASDPMAYRLEPLLDVRFERIPPTVVPRYQEYPLGLGPIPTVAESIDRYKGQIDESDPASEGASRLRSRTTSMDRMDAKASASSASEHDKLAHTLREFAGGSVPESADELKVTSCNEGYELVGKARLVGVFATAAGKAPTGLVAVKLVSGGWSSPAACTIIGLDDALCKSGKGIVVLGLSDRLCELYRTTGALSLASNDGRGVSVYVGRTRETFAPIPMSHATMADSSSANKVLYGKDNKLRDILSSSDPAEHAKDLQAFVRTLVEAEYPVTPNTGSSVSSQSFFDDSFASGGGGGGVRGWWGTHRVDHEINGPVGLSTLPETALVHIIHGSYFESKDFAGFVLRQMMRSVSPHWDSPALAPGSSSTAFLSSATGADPHPFVVSEPRDKWRRTRTRLKIKGRYPNHRGRDVVVCVGMPVTVTCKFMYGPFDLAGLTGEDIDFFVMTSPPSGEWVKVGTVQTDSNATAAVTVPDSLKLGLGQYPVTMVVRGDHTIGSCHVFVVHPGTEAIVFSIDGSFAASTSLSGADPKVQAGAVDVVRMWSDKGYLIVYVSSRPDIQQHAVMSWMAKHNFPQGVVMLADAISHEPAKAKARQLKQLVAEGRLSLYAGYGSGKDVAVYHSLGIPEDRIFAVGKTGKANCVVLLDGYSEHLSSLAHIPPAEISASVADSSAAGGASSASGSGSGFIRRNTLKTARVGRHPLQTQVSVDSADLGASASSPTGVIKRTFTRS